MDTVMDRGSGWKMKGKMDEGIEREIEKRDGLEGWTGWSEGIIDKRMVG